MYSLWSSQADMGSSFPKFDQGLHFFLKERASKFEALKIGRDSSTVAHSTHRLATTISQTFPHPTSSSPRLSKSLSVYAQPTVTLSY